MSVSPSLLRDARDWIDTRLGEIRQNGLLEKVNSSPESRPKQCIWWALEGDERMSEIVLWDTGEAELSFALIETGEIRCEHRDIDGSPALEDALQAVLDWVSVTA
ncbi:hypothetical protein ACFY19_05700 [Streptosporangium saharense]|uniref:hypothetical protein n=1 Tax=Streptosporangium saharense TaxID=1706840 RepID=UPI003693A699